ncbi:LOW QUALITY PROTEIN: F-box protein At1g15015 [Arabidopsis lyrata subsp. lyrata]|uniref:LOW QUALITY PROTEIN: F-box protein At1g15015 n=1 Tax=Arabidopsis lyrata subsp. lyrata TaxID=81972 RepID=UPI000A29C526|nr:LOW QUALITY PROTEIN: F-box protein At1g15015 [Arabidopsis lyrata subsp. lyrata]|eukprot:XP_020868932.1 LOW QUALITY PROTEIN: F-box protein At1g15015 [Arabidopsis lyrata subsp. lyrata]
MEVTLPHDVVEDILERLPVETLVIFRRVCSTRRSTIESQRFKERHYMIRGQLLEDPDILLRGRWDSRNLPNNVSLMTLTFDSSTTPVSFKTQTIPGRANFFKSLKVAMVSCAYTILRV